MQIKKIHDALLRNQRFILVNRQIILKQSDLHRIRYLGQKNTFSLVFSTYLIILMKKKEKEHKNVKLLGITVSFLMMSHKADR